MNETEEKIRGALLDLEVRQVQIANEWSQVTDAINALRRLLGEPISTEIGLVAGINAINSPSNTPPTASQNGKPKGAIPHFDSSEFFNKTQKDAVVYLLRKVGRPLKAIEIIDILKGASFPFASKDEGTLYQTMYTTLRRAAPDVVKHGKVWGLRAWSDQGPRAISGSKMTLEQSSIPKTKQPVAGSVTVADDD